MSKHLEMQTGSGLRSFNFCTRDEISHARLPEDLRSGSMDAFGHLVSDYKTLVYQFFHRLCVDNSFAEASAEMVFVRAFRARKILRKSTDLTSWIFRIACALAKRLAPEGSENCGVDGLPPIQRAMAALSEEKRITILLITNTAGQASYSGATTSQTAAALNPFNGSGTADNPNGPNGPRHNINQTFSWTEPTPCGH